MDGLTYVIDADEVLIATEYLMRVSEKLGNPTRADGPVGWKMVEVILRVWGGLFPNEKANMIADLEQEAKYERPVREAVRKDGGYFIVAYPPKLYQLLKTMLPDQLLHDKKFSTEFVNRYGFLKGTKHGL